MLKIFLALSFALNFLLVAYFVKPKSESLRSPEGAKDEYAVTRVIDGDSFIIGEGELAGREIRLNNINAPELNNCGGPESKAYLESLIGGKSLRLEAIVKDKFNRPLAIAYLGNTLINEQIVKNGWANFVSGASSVADLVKAASDQAKLDKVGIFGSLCLQTQNPDNPKCSIKGNNREGKKTYFFPGCLNYSNTDLNLNEGDQWFCIEAEAQKAGFVRSGNCRQLQFSP